MNRTKTIYFLSAIVLIIGCYALNLSYSLFTQTIIPENNAVDAIVPYIGANLENETYSIPANSSKLLKLKIINTGNSELKYGISVDDTKDLNIQLASGYNIVGTISAETEETEVWVYVTNGTENDVTDLTFSLTAKYVTLLFDEEDFISKSNIDCVNLYSLPNEPVLADGMIPVVYNDTDDVWEVADTSTEWYSYENQMWANAVTVYETASTCGTDSSCIDSFEKHDRSYYSSNPGTQISMDDINSMWVWIPRFKYNIPSDIGSEVNITNPPQINVVFEPNTESTGVSEAIYRTNIRALSANTNYYTHPAFRNINNIEYNSTTETRGAWDEEITGFWVGKFETGNTVNAPLIKPDIKAGITNQIVSLFKTSLIFAGGTFDTTTGEVTFNANENNLYGLNTNTNNTNTHMMKNTEWGAVAILSQSQFGKMGNVNYTGINKEIYKNDSSYTYTGRSSGTPPENGYSTYGKYSYNDKTCTLTSSECTGEKVIYKGTGASTTGTIYGIYDMSGGKYEDTMGNWGIDTSLSGFTIFPPSKYYDLYNGAGSDIITKEKAILGDATWETMKWYSDTDGSVNNYYPWTSRGGSHKGISSAGIFYSYRGAGDEHDSFHTVLMP